MMSQTFNKQYLFVSFSSKSLSIIKTIRYILSQFLVVQKYFVFYVFFLYLFFSKYPQLNNNLMVTILKKQEISLLSFNKGNFDAYFLHNSRFLIYIFSARLSISSKIRFFRTDTVYNACHT